MSLWDLTSKSRMASLATEPASPTTGRFMKMPSSPRPHEAHSSLSSGPIDFLSRGNQCRQIGLGFTALYDGGLCARVRARIRALDRVRVCASGQLRFFG